MERAGLADLLAATARHEEAAFQALYQETSGQLFAVVLRIVRRRDWAEEILQEAYVKIWDRAGSYQPEKGAPLTWMIAVARNRALDWLRRDRGEASWDAMEEERERFADPDPDPLDWAMAGDDARRLQACLERLEENARACVLLSLCEGYTHQELSERMATPLGTVKSWIRRSLQRLKVCLER